MIIDEKGQEIQTVHKGVTVTAHKQDGWGNLLTGLGKRGIDKTVHTYYQDYPQFADEELSAIYLGEGVGKKIITRAADDMTREWINIENDGDNKVENALITLQAQNKINYAIRMARLYRGSVALMVTNEGIATDLSNPIAKGAEVIGLKVYSAARIQLQDAFLNGDYKSNSVEDIELFPIRKQNGNVMYVHRSRLLIFKGEPAPDDCVGKLNREYKYWGVPVLQAIWSRLKNFGGMEQGLANVMMEFVVGKYTISNLVNILSQNDESALKMIYDRMDLINSSKSVLNSVLLGEGEKYERDTANIGGTADVMKLWMTTIAMVSDYPTALLWGQSPAGQNATGEFDIRSYYDMISTKQQTWLYYPMQRLVNTVASGLKLKTENYPIKFKPLWQLTEKEQADLQKTKAETYKLYIESGVYTPEEVRNEIEGEE